MVCRIITHFFRETITDDTVREAATRAAKLSEEIPEIYKLSVQTSAPGEHCPYPALHMVLLFENTETMERYLVHPAHVAFGNFIKPIRAMKQQSVFDEIF